MSATTHPVTIAGYSHLAISVSDLEASRRFYCDLLGFEELRRPDFGIPGMWLRVGTLQLHMIEVAEVHAPGPGMPHFALHVPTERYEATMAALRDGGARFTFEPRSRDDFGRTVWAAFVADPSGNIIELTDVGPLPAA